jgi:Protein phosphatase 2C
VEAAGGEVMWWNGERVMGVLAVSRSIGDHYLRPFVIAQPEVRAGFRCLALCNASLLSPRLTLLQTET